MVYSGGVEHLGGLTILWLFVPLSLEIPRVILTGLFLKFLKFLHHSQLLLRNFICLLPTIKAFHPFVNCPRPFEFIIFGLSLGLSHFLSFPFNLFLAFLLFFSLSHRHFSFLGPELLMEVVLVDLCLVQESSKMVWLRSNLVIPKVLSRHMDIVLSEHGRQLIIIHLRCWLNSNSLRFRESGVRGEVNKR